MRGRGQGSREAGRVGRQPADLLSGRVVLGGTEEEVASPGSVWQERKAKECGWQFYRDECEEGPLSPVSAASGVPKGVLALLGASSADTTTATTTTASFAYSRHKVRTVC
ncbi:hypothetical protein O3P69_004066 [Scylla paramamosain]|uniref:Uncharacterized protein n=1 Tax=Scylla paramamosain TaxID=85552 RepID=A0AAW0UFW9_SCYPA